jgi:ABC-type multidrug transport system fused ATPase/permease subunit
MSLPDGYQTAVGERGVGLSGGQRQRVAIARALLIVPDLLILDEATSFVDVESEERILSAVKSLRKGKKTLMMTHRASSLKFADKVYKLERGDLSS